MVTVNILTNDKHLWLLKGFSYCLNKFWPRQHVNVYGFGQPGFESPKNFNFISLAPTNYPVQKWSNSLIEMCHLIKEEHFIFMLEDFWLIEKVDNAGIKLVANAFEDNVLRVDLSGNRAAYTQARECEKINGYSIVETPAHTPYQMSFQAAIWDRKLLLSILKSNETPWEAEVKGSARLREKEQYRVLGAKDTLLNYKPVYRTRGHKLLLERMPKKLVRGLGIAGCLR